MNRACELHLSHCLTASVNDNTMANQEFFDPDNPALNPDGSYRTVEEMTALGATFPNSPSDETRPLPLLDDIPLEKNDKSTAPASRTERQRKARTREDPVERFESEKAAAVAARKSKKSGTTASLAGPSTLDGFITKTPAVASKKVC